MIIYIHKYNLYKIIYSDWFRLIKGNPCSWEWGQ